jgi:hypothetical protein
MPKSVLSQTDSIGSFVFRYLITLGQIIHQVAIGVIFKEGAIDYLRKVSIGIIGSGDHRIEVERLSDYAFYIFSAEVRLSLGLGIVEIYE